MVKRLKNISIKIGLGIAILGIPFAIIGMIYFAPEDQKSMNRLFIFLTFSIISILSIFRNNENLERIFKIWHTLLQTLKIIIASYLGFRFDQPEYSRQRGWQTSNEYSKIDQILIGAAHIGSWQSRLIIILLVLSILVLLFLLICIAIYLVGIIGSSKKVCLFAVTIISIVASVYYVLFTKYKEKETIEKIGVIIGVGGGTPGIFTFLIDPFID